MAWQKRLKVLMAAAVVESFFREKTETDQQLNYHVTPGLASFSAEK